MHWDAWIFGAIRDDGKKVDLADIVATADAHNHAIPLAQELSSGLNRLARAGYLQYEDDMFWLTEDGQKASRRAREPWKDIFTYWRNLEAELAEIGEPFPDAPRIVVTDEMTKEAYRRYIERYWPAHKSQTDEPA